MSLRRSYTVPSMVLRTMKAAMSMGTINTPKPFIAVAPNRRIGPDANGRGLVLSQTDEQADGHPQQEIFQQCLGRPVV